jgi:membrane protease subunit (stomatin/prohibitin family)
VSLGSFFRKQFVDVIHWTEPEDGVLAFRYPMQDMEIQNGAVLTVREAQRAVFVDEGEAVDAFPPGRYALTTATLPLLTNLRHWDKAFESPFKSDVYFFSTRVQTAQRWGTQQPVTVRDRDFGAVRLRAFGMYAYHLADPVTFMRRVSGTREVYRAADLEPQLRNLVVARMAAAFANSGVPFLDMAASTARLGDAIAAELRPGFAELGLALDTFTVESLSLPDELQRRLDERIGMGMVGDLGRYAQFQAAQAIPVAAANEGGAAGAGAGLAAGLAVGQAMAQTIGGALAGAGPAAAAPAGAAPAGAAPPAGAPGAPLGASATKFCHECGKPIARAAKFCPECGAKQA